MESNIYCLYIVINRLYVATSCCEAIKRLGLTRRCYMAKSEFPRFADGHAIAEQTQEEEENQHHRCCCSTQKHFRNRHAPARGDKAGVYHYNKGDPASQLPNERAPTSLPNTISTSVTAAAVSPPPPPSLTPNPHSHSPPEDAPKPRLSFVYLVCFKRLATDSAPEVIPVPPKAQV